MLAPAFLASASITFGLVQTLQPSRLKDCSFPAFDDMNVSTQDIVASPLTDAFRKKAWDTHFNLCLFLLKVTARARIKAESSVWLRAIPVSSLSLCLEDEIVCVATGLH